MILSHRVENALWLFICPRERAIKISQEVERTTKNAESRGKEIMADVINTTTEPTTNNEPQNEENTPSVEELMAQLASERAEKEKYKNRNSFRTTDSGAVNMCRKSNLCSHHPDGGKCDSQLSCGPGLPGDDSGRYKHAV